jgi:uncharacterized membrane protein
MRTLLLKNKTSLLKLMAIIYTVGIVGLLLPVSKEFFTSITPINIILVAAMVFAVEEKWNLNLIIAALVIGGLGFGVEVAGVHTGKIFGDYFYRDTLGPQFMGVPILLALNWFFLIYSIQAILYHYGILLSALLGSIALVVYDSVLEPFAINFNLWVWQGEGVPPVQNFLAWGSISFVLILLFRVIAGERKNKLAAPLLTIQFVFFTVLMLAKKFGI